MGSGRPLLDAGRTPWGTLTVLYDLLDQLPVRVAVLGVGDGFPVLHRNRRMRAAEPGLDLGRMEDYSLGPLAAEAVETRESRRLETEVVDASGRRRRRDWTVAPLVDARGEVVALSLVLDEPTQPALARRRMESAVDHGLHLLLEIARLAEDRPDLDDFLAGVTARLARLVDAERVSFDRYDAERRVLVHRPGPDGEAALGLPCDPAASDLLSQVVFAGRVYRGQLDLSNLELRPYAHLAHLWSQTGSAVLIVPWRAGNERLGAVVAQGSEQGFTDEHAIVLIAAGHAAGLVWQRRQAELRLAERARELESLEAAKSTFLLLASHELRTPLTLLNGYVSMLADGSQRPVDIVPILERAVGRMNVLVDQLMDAARMADGPGSLSRSPIDLRAAVRGGVDRVVGRWGREADRVLSLPEAAVPVLVDALRVETAVANLIDNACKYSEAGQPVRCELVVDAAAGVARLTVADEGVGMTEAETAGLFVRFGRMVDPGKSHAGAGLGLFLSREIARLHGGEITVTSAPGRGSRFELTLPLSTAVT